MANLCLTNYDRCTDFNSASYSGKKVDIAINLDLLKDFRTYILSAVVLKHSFYRYLYYHNVIGTFGLGRPDADPNFLPSAFEDMRYKYQITVPFYEFYFSRFNGYLLLSRESLVDEEKFAEFDMVDNFSYSVEFDQFNIEVVSPGGGGKKELKLETSLKRNRFTLNINTQ